MLVTVEPVTKYAVVHIDSSEVVSQFYARHNDAAYRLGQIAWLPERRQDYMVVKFVIQQGEVNV